MKRFAALLIVVSVLFVGTRLASGDRSERMCNHFIHLLVVLPDGRVLFPGKPGQWKNIDRYVAREVPGVMQVVEVRNYLGGGGNNNYQRLTIVERRCGG